MEKFWKIWSRVTTAVVLIVLIFTVITVCSNFVGLKTFTVMSGSMEPTYHVGALIYVKGVDTASLKEGDPITFAANEDTVVTHRIVKVINENGELKFSTKGDANGTNDAGLVNPKNIIGKPVFSIPYIGYAASFIKSRSGMILTVVLALFLMLMCIMPDFFENGKNKKTGKEQTAEEIPEISEGQS